MLSSRFLLVMSVGVLFAVTASASPVNFDGNIDGNDSYYDTLNDGLTEDPGIQDDLDIKSMGFDLYGGYLWMGLSVWDGPLATDGGVTSIPGLTVFYAVFETGSDSELLIITLDDGAVSSVTFNGTNLNSGTDYEAVLGTDETNGGLEIKISDSLLSPLTFNFFGQLDDTGFINDDQIEGFVELPEPMTLALIASGLPLVLIRRRRR